MEGDSLHRVDLRENNIAERGLMALYLAAQSNPQILRIDLTSNLISPDLITSSGNLTTHSSTSPSSTTNFDCSSLITQINLTCEANQKLQQKDEALIFHDQVS